MTKNTIFKSEQGRTELMNYYNELLGDWPNSTTKHIINTSYGETSVIECGDKSKPAIVLLHGSGTNSAMWTADVVELSSKYSVYAIDIIGECGFSSANRCAFKDGVYANWLNEVVSALDLETFSLIGCSLGGWVSLEFTIKYPARVNKLILTATAGLTNIKLSTLFWIIITSFFGNWGFKKLNKIVYGNIEVDSKVLKFAELVNRYFKPRTDVLPLFTDDELRSIKSKTLYIAGENDCFYNSDVAAQRLSKCVKFIETEVLEDTGHVLINQTEKIIGFLNSQYTIKSKFKGELKSIVERAQCGNPSDVDYLMNMLSETSTLTTTRNIDYSLSLVQNRNGVGRIKYYLFNGTQMQRNYACLFFKRAGDNEIVNEALSLGLVDELQAYSK